MLRFGEQGCGHDVYMTGPDDLMERGNRQQGSSWWQIETRTAQFTTPYVVYVAAGTGYLK